MAQLPFAWVATELAAELELEVALVVTTELLVTCVDAILVREAPLIELFMFFASVTAPKLRVFNILFPLGSIPVFGIIRCFLPS